MSWLTRSGIKKAVSWVRMRIRSRHISRPLKSETIVRHPSLKTSVVCLR